LACKLAAAAAAAPGSNSTGRPNLHHRAALRLQGTTVAVANKCLLCEQGCACIQRTAALTSFCTGDWTCLHMLGARRHPRRVRCHAALLCLAILIYIVRSLCSCCNTVRP
jgi:hypothetical protein